MKPGTTALCGTVQKPSQARPGFKKRQPRLSEAVGLWGGQGMATRPSGGYPSSLPLWALLCTVPALPSAGSSSEPSYGPLPAPNAQHQDSRASSTPAATVTHTQQGCSLARPSEGEPRVLIHRVTHGETSSSFSSPRPSAAGQNG